MNLDLMRTIDKQFLETPFYGVRQMTGHLRNDDNVVNEKRIRRLFQLMGLMPIYQKPNTRKAVKGHVIHPYLLRSLRVDRLDQVSRADITYLPMRRASCIWPQSWTGAHSRCWLVAYQTRWRQGFAPMR